MADDGDYYGFYRYSQLNNDNTTTFGEHNIFPLHEHPNHPFINTITTNSVPPPLQPQLQPQPQESNTREPDQYVPAANMIRIMRKILPPEAKIAEDSKETVQECVTEFISFITSEANDRCRRELRKTITAEDLLKAMEKLGFNEYLEPLAIYLNRYRIQVERPGILEQQQRQQNENAAAHAENIPVFDLGFEQYGYRPMFTPKTLKEFLMSGPGPVGEVTYNLQLHNNLQWSMHLLQVL
ncbi:Transcription factor CBF/NF-Y/archaeal histone domain [Dillenia turbinata]|uniref:Transcription factor CBF/NF-Y/archaeal histone domain n=1 Tax=Dillenia turbinata TaxID=194707 RepID=A0AAN8ZU99_9MAGN